jgi:hypothetical protein
MQAPMVTAVDCVQNILADSKYPLSMSILGLALVLVQINIMSTAIIMHDIVDVIFNDYIGGHAVYNV